MKITYDKKRGLFDFTMERGEDHAALSVNELLDLLQAEAPEYIQDWVFG
mgnify:FL=1